ncbi:hypothetical protein HYPSUDRAFT_203205 [Hypholoma sublateritium FD-334 SS-4]|uniref:Sulfatase-modifying factor enzyme domain-containing protein n=1 Tax=Hypholoma sublateritium (strain FD-334 SS-4) TaxID=945553 RepID=A0A0D2MCP8_HYPSF|nr:hypothetical protein HYPSUDRAFT_203205 [Hypholoma sublateritium FD-334 SS-4]
MPAEIIDIHSRSTDGFLMSDIAQQIFDGLSKPSGHKQLPTMLLYDECGLKLYDDITMDAPEYYLFAAEEEILKTNTDDIVRAMHINTGISSDEVILELGAGALRKTSHILLGLSRLVEKSKSCGPITYYALDLEQRELERTLAEIARSDLGDKLAGKVETKGLWGTYDDGLKFIQDGGLLTHNITSILASAGEHKYTPMIDMTPPLSPVSLSSNASSPPYSDSSAFSTPEGSQSPLHIMFLGSSIGNFSREEGALFLRSLPLRPGSGDTLLMGLDHDNEKAVIEDAYNDPKGHTKRFILNGLRHAGRALGDENLVDENDWDYVNVYNVPERRHEAFLKSKYLQMLREPRAGKEFTFSKDELIKIEQSLKFSEEDMYSMFVKANLRPIQRWLDKKSQYSLWLLERPPFLFPLLSSPSQNDPSVRTTSKTPFGVPSRVEWYDLWASWDFITRNMIPHSMLFQKPIDLRHICLFYLGHIPTFLDIHLSNILQEPNTEPQEFKHIFERGIDPNVDDPSQCHTHSEVPLKDEDWPSHRSVLEFQDKVRARLMRLYDDIDAGRITLTHKIGRVLFITLEHEAMHAETLLYMLLQRAGSGTIPPPGFRTPNWPSLAIAWNETAYPETDTVTLGPATVVLGHDDNEDWDATPKDDIESHEFGWDNEHPRRAVHIREFRIEWRPVTNGEFYRYYNGVGRNQVRLPASWVEDDEGIKVRTLYGPVSMDVAQDWPVIAPYDILSTYATVKGGRLPTEAELSLFYKNFESGYEGGANVGFRNWHPVPATTGSKRNSGKGSNGGVWEWTSTVFESVEGFEPSKLYPGYSMDFFDGKHHVVLGGSYATIPRIAERKSFRNWYQRNYPYAWAGARIVYDV